MFPLVLKSGNFRVSDIPTVANEDKSDFFFCDFAVPNSTPTLSLGLSSFRVQSLRFFVPASACLVCSPVKELRSRIWGKFVFSLNNVVYSGYHISDLEVENQLSLLSALERDLGIPQPPWDLLTIVGETFVGFRLGFFLDR